MDPVEPIESSEQIEPLGLNKLDKLINEIKQLINDQEAHLKAFLEEHHKNSTKINRIIDKLDSIKKYDKKQSK